MERCLCADNYIPNSVMHLNASLSLITEASLGASASVPYTTANYIPGIHSLVIANT